jgi:hypothetical protein
VKKLKDLCIIRETDGTMNAIKSIYYTPVTQHFMNKPQKQIQIKLGENVVTAKLNNTQVSQDFITFLPLSFTLTDLFGVQKYSCLPKALSETGQQMQTAEIGDIAYWSPGPGLIIFYRQHNLAMDSGLYLLGKIDADAKFLNIDQSSMVKIEII